MNTKVNHLEDCKYYYEIVNYQYEVTNIFTEMLINEYQELVLNDNYSDDLKMYDEILYNYITNASFNKYVLNEVDTKRETYPDNYLDYLVECYNKYMNEIKIESSWL